jgi:histidinol-phosphatase
VSADLGFAIELADIAGQLAMERFRAPDLMVQTKDDGSPVTDADREIERVLRERIAQQRPEHAITGEEYGERGESEWRWYLDPIDGTTSYVEGGQNWKTLIALTRAGRLELAVIDAPVSAARWWAVRGQGAFRDGKRLRASSTRSLSAATVADDWRHTLARGNSDHPLARIAARSGHVVPHRGHSFLALAGGEVDVAVGVGGFAWDYAPMMLIVEEAGGRFTDLAGRRRFDSGNALVSNGAVHDEALRVLDEYPVAAHRGST